MRFGTGPFTLLAAACAATFGNASVASAGEVAGGNSSLQLELTFLGRYDSGIRGASAAEIVQHDPLSQRLFVVNAQAHSVDVLSIADPSSPTLVTTLTEPTGVANSVAIHQGLVAVAFEAALKTDLGRVVFFNAQTLQRLAEFQVGAQPDMLTFTPDGEAVLVANEGEANNHINIPPNPYDSDPVGSVSVIDLRLVNNPLDAAELQLLGIVRTAGFAQFNAEAPALRARGVRIYGPDDLDDADSLPASVAQDLEPEYIAVAHDGQSAWVTLQEANAIGVLDLSDLDAPYFSDILPLGLKDHSLPGNELDAGDRDAIPATDPPTGRLNITNWPVKGMYQPDAVASFAIKGKTYYVLANEGDDRNDFMAGEETIRVRDIPANQFDPAVFGNATAVAALRNNANLGRLTVTKLEVPKNTLNQYQALHVLGGRSFSVRDADGTLLYDSGSEFERRTQTALPEVFNTSNDNNALEDRSDNKGPEPEGVAVGKIRGRTFAFIGLERIGGIMTYDVTNPSEARFVDYVNTRILRLDPLVPAQLAQTNDLGPEGVAFISADDSPNGKPLLVVGHEVSGTTVLYSINVTGK